MLSTVLADTVVVGWSWTPGRASTARETDGDTWSELDQKLRSIAKRRAALDIEELALIRRAVAVQLWRPLGMTSMREYLEQVMGYGPRVASERLRVAEALEALPVMEAALACGELSYSSVRELTRIATRKTDEAWVDAARGKNVRQVEEMVAEREPGDSPADPAKPDLRTRRVWFDLRPADFAMMREVRLEIETERGERLDDRELFRELCARALQSRAPDSRAPRPRHQIAVTVCALCQQGRQHGAGVKIAVRPEELSMARCDAHEIGSLDSPPGKLGSSIPPATRRVVFQRDGFRCTVPGCRSAQNLDIHHIVFREHGGGHEPENLTLLCDGHHGAVHEGKIRITGSAPNPVVFWSWDVPAPERAASHVGGESDAEALPTLPTQGLTKRGASRTLKKGRAGVDSDGGPKRPAQRRAPRGSASGG